MIESLWQTGRYVTRLNTLHTKPTVGVHRALVQWSDGEVRDSHVKIVFADPELPYRHLVHEAVGWLVARALGLPVPPLAGFLILDASQVAAAHPTRPRGGQTLAWVTSTEPESALQITDQMQRDAHLLKELRAWRHLSAACAFDESLGNNDRYPRNLLRVGDGQFTLIDHDNIAGGSHWLADALVDARWDLFLNVLRERCAPARGAPPCPERAFNNDMVGHSERHDAAVRDSANMLLQWITALLDDKTDAWALVIFIASRAQLAPALIRKRYGLLM